MRKYCELIILNIKNSMAYKAELFFSLLKTIMLLIIQIAIWKKLYGSDVDIFIKGGDVDVTVMINYGIISSFISIAISNGVIGNIGTKVRTGDVAIDLIKPLSFMGNILSQVIGEMVFRLVLVVLPLFVILYPIYKMMIPSWFFLLSFLLSFINAFIIMFLITYMVGLTAFWYFEIWHFERLLDDIIKVLSGSIIPLWFFPKPLVFLSDFLPFKYIYYVPINVYMERMSAKETLGVLGFQLFWILILFLFAKCIWSKCINKIVVQGG